LLGLSFLLPDQLTDSLHAYQISKRGNSLRVMAEARRVDDPAARGREQQAEADVAEQSPIDGKPSDRPPQAHDFRVFVEPRATKPRILPALPPLFCQGARGGIHVAEHFGFDVCIGQSGLVYRISFTWSRAMAPVKAWWVALSSTPDRTGFRRCGYRPGCGRCPGSQAGVRPRRDSRPLCCGHRRSAR
jgi:hypothetical protein